MRDLDDLLQLHLIERAALTVGELKNAFATSGDEPGMSSL